MNWSIKMDAVNKHIDENKYNISLSIRLYIKDDIY